MGRGRLLFKGDKEKSKKKKKKVKHNAPTMAAATVESPSAATAAERTAAPKPPAASATTPQIQTGQGQITTSGTVVTGLETRFTRQVQTGDALMVLIGGKEEMRVVTMSLSDTSLNLSSAFSQSLSTPTAYRLIAKPRAPRERKSDSTTTTAVADPMLDEGNGRELVYREPTEHGSYRIRRVQLDHEASRGAMLEMRAKKKRDKYC